MTREELKKRIEQIIDMFDVSVVNGIAEVPLTKEDREALDMAISALKGGWIPIEERLPEIEGDYWVTVSRPYGTWVDRATFLTEDKYFIRGSLILYDVTAWRKDGERYKKPEEGGKE